MEEVPDELIIIILSDVVSKRHYVLPAGSIEKDTRISYYATRLVNKNFCRLVTSEVVIPVLEARITVGKIKRVNTIFKNIGLIIPIITRKVDSRSFPLFRDRVYSISAYRTNTTWDKILKEGDIEILFLRLDRTRFSSYKYCEFVISNNLDSHTLRLLLTHPLVDPCEKDNSLIKLACSKRSYDMVRVLLERRSIDTSRLPYLKYPKEEIKTWSSDIVDRKVEYFRCLQEIISHNDVVFIKILLSLSHLDLTIEHNYILRFVSRYMNIETVKLLLTKPDINPDDAPPGLYTAREIAEVEGNIKLMELFELYRPLISNMENG